MRLHKLLVLLPLTSKINLNISYLSIQKLSYMKTKKNSKEQLPLADMHADGTRFNKKTLAALKAQRKIEDSNNNKSNTKNQERN